MLQLHRSLSQRLRQNIADLQLESQKKNKPQVNRTKTEKVEIWSLGHFIYRKPALQNKHLSSGMCMTLVCCLPETNSEDRTDRSKMLQLGMNLQMTLPSHLRGGNRRLHEHVCECGWFYLFVFMSQGLVCARQDLYHRVTSPDSELPSLFLNHHFTAQASFELESSWSFPRLHHITSLAFTAAFPFYLRDNVSLCNLGYSGTRNTPS